jgi:ribonuclease P protein component
MESTHSRKFPKHERLTSKKLIEELFSKGSSVFLYPYKLVYLPRQAAEHSPPEVLFSVSKRHFKRAVDRNQLKRRIREAYRLHKADFLLHTPPEKIPAYFAILYMAKEKNSFELLEKKLILVWQRIITGTKS